MLEPSEARPENDSIARCDVSNTVSSPTASRPSCEPTPHGPKPDEPDFQLGRLPIAVFSGLFTACSV